MILDIVLAAALVFWLIGVAILTGLMLTHPTAFLFYRNNRAKEMISRCLFVVLWPIIAIHFVYTQKRK